MYFGNLSSKFCLYAFFVLTTFSLKGQVVLNEIYIRPDGLSTTPPNGLIYTDSKEYIELYNKGCTPINVAGYFIATKQNGFGTVVTGITIRIPNVPAANIPPGGHIVLGSAGPGVGLVGNIDIPISAADRCNYANNIVIANVDGWVGLYNAAGVALDCVYWSGSAGNITANPSDFNPGAICLPAGSPAVTLQTPTQINASNPAILSFIANSTPIIVYRQQDGSPTWNFTSTFNAATLPWTINNASPTGNCNGGTCVTPPLPSAPVVTTPITYCQNAISTPLTATASAGGVLNWWGTNPTGGTSTATAPTPSTAVVGSITYYVSQTVGGCESPRSAIVVTVNPSWSSIISCGTSTASSVTFDWTWVNFATGYSISYQVNSGSPINIGSIGNALTYTVNSLNSGDNVTITVTPLGGSANCYTATSFSCATLVNNACGACATPTCPIIGVANYPVRNFSPTSCNTWLPSLTNTTIKSYYLVQSDANGFVGLVQQAGGSPALCITRTAVLRPLGSSCSVAANVNPSIINSNGVASGFNPEWYGLTPNTAYVIEVTITLGAGCTLDSLCSNYYGCSTPAAPTASITIQPTCTTPTGTLVVTSPVGAANLYSIDGVNYQTSPTFSGLAPNNYQVTVKKTPSGCISNGTALVVNAVPSIAAPTASASVQPTCTTPTGTILVSAPTGANLEYSVNGTTYQASTSFSGLAPGAYNVTVRNTTNGCVSTAIAVTINTVPSIAAPTASASVQPTCTTPTGTILVSVPTGANFEYSINGTTYQTSTSFSGLAPGAYNVTVRNTTNGCVSTATAVTINALPPAITPAFLPINPICYGTTLTLPTTSQNGIIGTWSPNFDPLQSSAYLFTPNPGQCAINTSINIQVNPLPNPLLTPGKICVDVSGVAAIPYRLDTGLSNSNYSFQWYIDGVLQVNNTNYFDATVAGNYSVIATNTASGCSSNSVSANVIAVEIATDFTATLASSTLSNTTTIIATVTGGTGTYLYALDDFDYQTSNIFVNVLPGLHTVSVLDVEGCSEFDPISITSIGYPYFFTPNQDGFNDTWNVIGLEDQESAKLFIFDRYGKLLKQLSTQGNGWDGTYLNQQMPASDYWFSLEYIDNNGLTKKFGSHFSLKR